MTRIPLPGNGGEALQKGVESGTNLWQQLLGQGVNLGRMHQQGQQFDENKTYQYTALEQKIMEHMQQQALREQTEARHAQEFEMKKEKHPHEIALLKNGGRQRVTASIQEADALFNGDREDPGWRQYVLNKSKQVMPNEHQLAEDEKLMASPEWEKISPYLKDAVDMNPMPVASQNYYRKQMNEEMQSIDKAKQVVHALDQAENLMKNNPDLYKKAINIIADPDKSPGMIEKALTAFLPKEQVEVFTQAAKLYADILTKQAQLNNMSRSVYALKLQQQAKPQVKNPDETNMQIFKNIRREIAPSMDREKALIYAMKHNQYLPFTKNYDLGEGQENKIPTEVGNPTPMGMMKGIDKEGHEHNIHPSNKEDFIAEGGKIL